MIKIRLKPQGAYTQVRLLIEHPMETGRRRDPATDKLAPAHFITELLVELNGKNIIKGLLSTAVSKDPYFSFRLNQAKPGDLLRVTWADNLGQSDSAEVRIGASST